MLKSLFPPDHHGYVENKWYETDMSLHLNTDVI